MYRLVSYLVDIGDTVTVSVPQPTTVLRLETRYEAGK